MNDAGSNSVRQKKWIVVLLSVTCLSAFLLYISLPPLHPHTIQHSGQIDSLIIRTLAQFQIPEQRIQRRDILVDSTFARLVYSVELPPEVSKTYWHYELDKQVREYGIRTPARVTFPERDIQIHLVYRSTIIRTIHLSGSSGSEPQPDVPF